MEPRAGHKSSRNRSRRVGREKAVASLRCATALQNASRSGVRPRNAMELPLWNHAPVTSRTATDPHPSVARKRKLRYAAQPHSKTPRVLDCGREMQWSCRFGTTRRSRVGPSEILQSQHGAHLTFPVGRISPVNRTPVESPTRRLRLHVRLGRSLALPCGNGMRCSHRPGRANLPVSRAFVEAPPRQPRLRERLGRSLAPPDVSRQRLSLVIHHPHSSFFILPSSFCLQPSSSPR